MFKRSTKTVFSLVGLFIALNSFWLMNPSLAYGAESPCAAPLHAFEHSSESSYSLVFPLITSDMNNTTDPNGCNPAVWDQNIVFLFILKALVLLNWSADVVAVLATVYAGILYISGFANENNVKQAKNILIACYVGLAIVFSARLIFNEVLTTTTGSPTVNLDKLYPSSSTSINSNTGN